MKLLIALLIFLSQIAVAQMSPREQFESRIKQKDIAKRKVFNTLAEMDLFVYCGSYMGLGRSISAVQYEFTASKIKPRWVLGISRKNKSIHTIYVNEFNRHSDSNETKSHYRNFNSPWVRWDDRGYSFYQLYLNSLQLIQLKSSGTIQWGGKNGYELEFTNDGFVFLYSADDKKPCVKVTPNIEFYGKKGDDMVAIQDNELYFVAASRVDFHLKVKDLPNAQP